MTRRRLSALAALVCGLAAVALAIVVAATSFPRGILVTAGLVLMAVAAWQGILRHGAARAGRFAVAGALAVAVIVTMRAHHFGLLLGALACLWLTVIAARTAFRIHVPLPSAPRPQRPVLFYNPKSGGGKATQFHLPEEARARGIEPIELTLGTDLETLVRQAVADGADALAMAGGDGSQAIVAKVAAEKGLPYACIPAGTRNHFALDLGVDRDDVVGALDAFVDGGERLVDLGEVNGQVFVNNVSLGLYAEAVQKEGYRDAKMRTLLATAPEMLAPDAEGPELRWAEPDGEEHTAGAAILVSNNRYRLGHLIGSGTRPRIDDGVLGVTVIGGAAPGGNGRGAPRLWRQWEAPVFDVEAGRPVPCGVDGEAMRFDPPLHFEIHPAALRCRVARTHPGASPSAFEPDGSFAAVRALAGIAVGHDPRPVPGAHASRD